MNSPTPITPPTGIEAMVCEDIARRQAHGVAKYGQTLAANPLPLPDWLQHAYEEAIDLALYLKRARCELLGTVPTAIAEPVPSNGWIDTDTERSQRVAFEAWAKKRWGACAYLHTGPTSGEWDAWQAASAPVAPADSEARCSQCKKEYRHGCGVGCPKCAPGVSVPESEFRKPINAEPAPVAPAARKAALVHALVNAGDFPSMSEAFDRHIGCSAWTDPAWRSEVSTWAAAWRAALAAAPVAPAADRALIADLLSALEYHVEQTRPIHSTTTAIAAAREYLHRQPAAPVAPAMSWDNLAKFGRVDRLKFRAPGTMDTELCECVVLTRADVERLVAAPVKPAAPAGDWESAYSKFKDGEAFPPGTPALKVAFAAGVAWAQDAPVAPARPAQALEPDPPVNAADVVFVDGLGFMVERAGNAGGAA